MKNENEKLRDYRITSIFGIMLLVISFVLIHAFLTEAPRETIMNVGFIIMILMGAWLTLTGLNMILGYDDENEWEEEVTERLDTIENLLKKPDKE